jgi:hypothetical protein
MRFQLMRLLGGLNVNGMQALWGVFTSAHSRTAAATTQTSTASLFMVGCRLSHSLDEPIGHLSLAGACRLE